MRYIRSALCAGALVAIASAPLHAQDRALGDWHGVLDTPTGARLTLLVRVRGGPGESRSGDLESIDQVTGRKIPLADVTTSALQLAFAIPSINATYEGSWSDTAQAWIGTFRQGMALPLVLRRGTPPPAKVVEGLDGTWRATLQRGTANLRLMLHVQTTQYGTRARLDSPDMGAMGLQVEQIARSSDSVRFRVPMAQVQFSGALGERARSFGGTWSRPDQPDARVMFVRDSVTATAPMRTQWPIVPKGYRAEHVSFANPVDGRVTLAGTLTIPEGRGRFPAVVLISGSGPQDRDETIFGHKPFAVLGDHLSRRGIAVLRYDDRGFAESTGEHASATSADFATDANAAVRYLLGRADIDPKAIGFVGHSEGGMIGPIAAADNDRVAFLVLLAGPGTRTDQLILSQRRAMGLLQGVTDAELDRTEPFIRGLLHTMRDAADSADAMTRARAFLTPEVLTALGGASTQRDAVAARFTNPWMRYFLAYDAPAVLSRIRVPVLAINGSLDTQVPSAENLAAIRLALAKNPDATVRELPGLNHFFQTARTGAIGEYDRIAETFSPSAMQLISDWIAKRFGEGRPVRGTRVEATSPTRPTIAALMPRPCESPVLDAHGGVVPDAGLPSVACCCMAASPIIPPSPIS
jgi:uncharacterized protein